MRTSCTIYKRQELTADLVEGLLEEGLSVRTIVTGRSMSPIITSGDTVTITPVSFEKLNHGDIVLIKRGNGRLLVHRIVLMDKSCREVRTKGDSLGSLDPAAPAENVLGLITSINRYESGAINTYSPLWKQIGILIAVYGLVKTAYAGMRRRLGITFSSIF